MSEIKCLGINLGLKNCCAACYRSESDIICRSTPSTVFFGKSEVLVGIDPTKYSEISPETLFYETSEIIGRKIDDPYIQKAMENKGFKIFRDAKGNPVFRVATERYNSGTKYNGKLGHIEVAPEQISAMVLSNLKEIINKEYKSVNNECVFAVPADFNEQQIQATREIASIARLKCVDVISAPVAAAISYLNSNGKKSSLKYVLVCNYSDFEVNAAIVKIDGYDITLVSSKSKRVNQSLDEYIFDLKKKEIGSKMIDKPPNFEFTLHQEIKNAIRVLSGGNECAFINTGYYTTKISQIDIDIYFKREKDSLSSIFDQKKVFKEKVSDVIFIGKSFIKNRLYDLIRTEYKGAHFSSIESDEAIAKGAALYCANKHQFNIFDVAPNDVGFGISPEQVIFDIEKFSVLPYTGEWKKISVSHHDESLNISVYKGDQATTDYINCIGTYEYSYRTSSESDIYCRLIYTSDKITLCISETKNYEQPREKECVEISFPTNDSLHTQEEIALMRDAIIGYMSCEKEVNEIAYQMKIFKVINAICDSYAKNAESKNKVKMLTTSFKREISGKYSDETMTRLEYESYIKKIENEIKALVPDFTFTEKVHRVIDDNLEEILLCGM